LKNFVKKEDLVIFCFFVANGTWADDRADANSSNTTEVFCRCMMDALYY
jgi:hypothetical protein